MGGAAKVFAKAFRVPVTGAGIGVGVMAYANYKLEGEFHAASEPRHSCQDVLYGRQFLLI